MTFNPFSYLNIYALEDVRMAMTIYCAYDDDEKNAVVNALTIEDLNTISTMLGAIVLYELATELTIVDVEECIQDLATRIKNAHGTSFLN